MFSISIELGIGLSPLRRLFLLGEEGIEDVRHAAIDGAKPCVSTCRPRVTVCNDCGFGLPQALCQKILAA
jgi:hypothetical protein